MQNYMVALVRSKKLGLALSAVIVFVVVIFAGGYTIASRPNKVSIHTIGAPVDTSALASGDTVGLQQLTAQLQSQLTVAHQHPIKVAAFGTVQKVQGNTIVVQKVEPQLTPTTDEDSLGTQIYSVIGSADGAITVDTGSQTHYLSVHSMRDIHPGDTVIVGGLGTKAVLQAEMIAVVASAGIGDVNSKTSSLPLRVLGTTVQPGTASVTNLTSSSTRTTAVVLASDVAPISQYEANLHMNGWFGLPGFSASAKIATGSTQDVCRVVGSSQSLLDLHAEWHWVFKLGTPGRYEVQVWGISRPDTTSVQIGGSQGKAFLGDAGNASFYSGFGAAIGVGAEVECSSGGFVWGGSLDAVALRVLSLGLSNYTFAAPPLAGDSKSLDIPHDLCASAGYSPGKLKGKLKAKMPAIFDEGVNGGIRLKVCPELSIDPAALSTTATFDNGRQQQLSLGDKPVPVDQNVAGDSTSVQLSNFVYAPKLSVNAEVSVAATASAGLSPGDKIASLLKSIFDRSAAELAETSLYAGYKGVVHIWDFTLNSTPKESSVNVDLLPASLSITTTRGTFTFTDVTAIQCAVSPDGTHQARSGFVATLQGIYQGKWYFIITGGDLNGNTHNGVYQLLNMADQNDPQGPGVTPNLAFGFGHAVTGGELLIRPQSDATSASTPWSIRTVGGTVKLARKGALNDIDAFINGQVHIASPILGAPLPTLPASGTISGNWHCTSPIIIH